MIVSNHGSDIPSYSYSKGGVFKGHVLVEAEISGAILESCVLQQPQSFCGLRWKENASGKYNQCLLLQTLSRESLRVAMAAHH